MFIVVYDHKGTFLVQIAVFEIHMAFACKYPENETLSLGDPVKPKTRILEVWVGVMSTNSLVKKFGPLVCVGCVVVLWVRPFLHRWVCT
jgi:hypothetical protein